MALISAKGKSFTQGSSDKYAGPSEGPAIKNSFTYDFQIDSTEVTQGYFSKLMGRDPIPAASPFGKGEKFPVYNISWYDAILFCNARSKESGLDTVYTYTRLEQNTSGSVYNLIGLNILLNQKGFRLPTEAEWEFADRGGNDFEFPWGNINDTSHAKEYAWYSNNANVTTHAVSTLKPNGYGLFDMAGNVMEWVNDWKGPYPAIGTPDFTGARDPGPEFDAPVKGGAFKYGLHELRVANRTSTYTTIRSATAEYVGFRCALGPISTPHYSTTDGNLSETDPVSLNISRIANLVEGRPTKLVFVNVKNSIRHLAYIDYAQNPIRVQEFSDVANVFYPVISPDGKWVAFATAIEGAVTGSDLYIRKLGDSSRASLKIGSGFIPRWWVDPATGDTFLIYTNSALDNTQSAWSGTQTLMQKIQDGKAIGSPQTLTDAGFHDGRSQDGRWLATGFRQLKIRDGVTGKLHTLFTAPENGKAAGDTSQVCNVSIAPDSSGRTLFLDFGYDAKSSITGSFYDIHEIAFMADTEGKILHWFKAPREERGWADLEWTNQGGYAIAGATDEKGGRGHLYLLDMKDSIATKLVSGTDLEMPGMWLGGVGDSIDATGLDLDSLGHYDDPATDAYQSVFSSHMALFWKRHASLELIFTGSSHVFSGIDPNQISKLNCLSMGYPANGWEGQEAWVKGYALNHCPKLKVLVMEIFPGWLRYKGADFTWLNKISKSKGVQYDIHHDFWGNGTPLNFYKKISQSPNSTLYTNDSLGFYPTPTVNWGGPALKPDSSDWGIDNLNYKENMDRIERFCKIISDKKIHLILVNFPTNPIFKSSDYYGPYGPKIEIASLVISRVKMMESISPYIHFYDANNFNDHDYSDSEASNSGHLSEVGAAKLTKRLDSLINLFP